MPKSVWTRYETYAHDAVIPLLAVGKAIDVIPRRCAVGMPCPRKQGTSTSYASFSETL
jgi:hypothetical protein